MKKMFRIFMEFSKADEHLHSMKSHKPKLKSRNDKNSQEIDDENIADLLSKIAQS